MVYFILFVLYILLIGGAPVVLFCSAVSFGSLSLEVFDILNWSPIVRFFVFIWWIFSIAVSASLVINEREMDKLIRS